MRIGILISSARVVRPTWTTAHLAHAALADQHQVRIIEAADIEVTTQGRLVARTHVLDAPLTSAAELATRLSERTLSRRYVELSTLDMLLLRANPLTSHVLSMALLAAEQGVRVHNDPAGIVRTRSKAWLPTLPNIPTPQTLVTRQLSSARLFAENLDGDVVLKPCIGSGGHGVQRVRQGNKRGLSQAFSEIHRRYPGPVVVQACAKDAEKGEKRVFCVDGKIVGAYLRTRAPGAFLHNLQQGATPTPCAISSADQAIVQAITPHLARNGIRIAGLDIIGGELIEVNTLNPGGIHYAETFREGADEDGPGWTIAAQVIRTLTTLPNWNLSEANPA
jgi:glutathione synthase